MAERLNPGSEEAVRQGCTCPILDNARGRGAYISASTKKPVFWYDFGCPLHGKDGSLQGEMEDARPDEILHEVIHD